MQYSQDCGLGVGGPQGIVSEFGYLAKTTGMGASTIETKFVLHSIHCNLCTVIMTSIETIIR